MNRQSTPPPSDENSPAAPAAPLWVSIEGINGVGKTSAARATAAALGPGCLLLDELTDIHDDVLPGRVITALNQSGDPFLRNGYPVVETLALLALQVRKAEILANEPTSAEVIIEDRGVDSVAVYQAAVLCFPEPPSSPAPAQPHDCPPESTARAILSSIRGWRPFPDLTILLTDDPTVSGRRFADRIHHQLSPADTQLLAEIDRLYRALADDEPERYVVLDVTGTSLLDSAEAVQETIRARLQRRHQHPQPDQPDQTDRPDRHVHAGQGHPHDRADGQVARVS